MANDATPLSSTFTTDDVIRWLVKKRDIVFSNPLKNKAGYTAQDAPSMRTFHLRK